MTDPLSQISQTIALSMGSAWASGINLYATVFVLGILGVTDNIVLPENLQILTNPIVIGSSGVMFLAEFVADKVPGVDTSWDAVHTFVRIPAGALLAAGAVGEVNPALTLTAGILGGGVAAGTHAAKAGTRALINTSPEPVTNWIASFSEDIAVVAGIWTAMNYPLVFIGFLIVFILLMIWLLPKIWKGIKNIFAAIGRLMGRSEQRAGTPPAPPNSDGQLETGPASGAE